MDKLWETAHEADRRFYAALYQHLSAPQVVKPTKPVNQPEAITVGRRSSSRGGREVSQPKTQGCANSSIHEGHEWSAVVHGRKHNVEARWCPGRVECDTCGKNIFTSTAATVPGIDCTCRGGCR